jgi:hypothetical protein
MSISNSAKRLGRRFGVSEGKLQASEARTNLGKGGAGLGNLWDSGGRVASSEHGEDFTAPALALSLLRVREGLSSRSMAYNCRPTKVLRVMTQIFKKQSPLSEGLTRKFLCLCSVGAGLLLLGHPARASAAIPDGSIELLGGKVAAGIGYSWGAGTLFFHGKQYPITLNGLSLGTAGISKYTASGTVIGLKKAQNINGRFTAVSTGLTLDDGASIAEMKNDNGVIIHLLDSTSEGLGASIALKAVHISIAR